MKVLHALIFDGESPNLYTIDAIEYLSGVWIVTKWLVNQAEGNRKPERIIRIDNLPHQRMEWAGHDFSLLVPIPKAVLDGQTTSGYEVIISPNISFPILVGIH